MLSVSVREEFPSLVSKARIIRVVKTAAKYEPKITGAVEICTVSREKIKKINARYRGINKVTDVLSFAWQEGTRFPGTATLGELYISPQKIVAQAREFNVSAEEEYIRMLIHGLLHLVGYDHMIKKDAQEMFALQEKIVAEIFSQKN
ncbi:MAG TPA: rRNA maturation RNase YbeY [Patescibacteria group bacterium]|nr:rRNA maturation RNase YbeY [Patescibacteria group bacterium]